jgi:hypothetical protein
MKHTFFVSSQSFFQYCLHYYTGYGSWAISFVSLLKLTNLSEVISVLIIISVMMGTEMVSDSLWFLMN